MKRTMMLFALLFILMIGLTACYPEFDEQVLEELYLEVNGKKITLPCTVDELLDAGYGLNAEEYRNWRTALTYPPHYVEELFFREEGNGYSRYINIAFGNF